MKLEVNKDAFSWLLSRVKNLEPERREIDAGNGISLVFRYCTVRIGKTITEEVQFSRLDPRIGNDDVISLAFDLKGLHPDYVTQVEVTRENSSYIMYLIPDRDKNKVESFISQLG